MANLLGQNIGTNYKGILNLNTLNGNLSGTLQAVTDGDGNASPLQLSTGLVRFGGGSGFYYDNSSNRLGLGSNNPVASLDIYANTAGTAQIRLGNVGTASAWQIGRDNATTGRLAFISNGVERVSFLDNFVGLGITNPTARLQVRGDGTNPIARFENNAGTRGFIFNATGDLGPIDAGGQFGGITAGFSTGFTLGGGIGGWSKDSGANHLFYSIYQNGFRYTTVNNTATSGTSYIMQLNQTFAAAAGSANFRPFILEYTINNSAAQTGTATGIFLNATPTALDGMTHNLMDLQSGGASRFRVAANGQIFTSDAIFTGGGLRPTSGSNIVLRDSGGTTFGLLQLGGTTNAFPAIKRNASSAAIDFRLADDSTFCAVNTNTYRLGDTANTITKNSTIDGINILGFGGVSLGSFGFQHSVLAKANCFGVGVGTSILASAALQVDSTTKGFLPPRMTTTEKNAIATPASGLVVYDSTLNKLAVYTGSAWETVTSI
jgi:hypothetical protein